MKIRHFYLSSLFLCLVLGLSLRLLAEDGAVVAPAPGEFSISSISVQGTNLVLNATIPPDIGQVILQIRGTSDAVWQDGQIFDIPAGTVGAVFTFPKPTNEVCFFRLEATNLVPPKTSGVSNVQVSTELRYVTMPSLGTTLENNGDAVFHFKGFVDGSDKIFITHEGAFWSHLNWDWPPVPVTINGNRWNPEAKNYMTTVGDPEFLPAKFSLDTATLEVTEARDVVAVERATNGLIVYLDDTPVGAGEYEFKIHFHPADRRLIETGLGVAAHLKIAANIDGSDCLKITATNAVWQHKNWSFPTDVTMNKIHWSPEQTNILANQGTNMFLPSGVDLSTAKIVRRTGRDLATMWAGKDVLWVWFADNPNGSDHYELDLSFGQ
jgi:hypothetical protein